jgi:hypothetical protein
MKRISPASMLFVVLISVVITIGLIYAKHSRAEPSDKSITTFPSQEGTIVAHLKDYDPKVYGYGFRNYGHNHANEKDLDAGDLIKLFGAENVCESGDTAASCVLYEPAEQWLDQEFKMLAGGHCDGLAMTSLRFWLGLPFDGKSTPANWQSGAHKVSDLQQTDALDNYVAYVHVMQSLPEIYEYRAENFKHKPSEILHLLEESMKDDSDDRLELAIYMKVDGRLTHGHAIVPYAIEDMGDGEYHIHVYDSNYPNTSKYVELNAKEETWRYHTASDPSQTANDYVGDANSHSLTVQNLAARELDSYDCPFCEDASNARLHHAQKKKNTRRRDDDLGFTLDGEGEYMITDPNGKHIGYDFAKSRFVNEIPDAGIVPYTGGMNLNVPAQYFLPNLHATRPYTINVAGKSINREVDADMEMAGPGFFVGFEGIQLDPGESLSMSIAPNGTELSFTASADGETPKLFIAIGADRKQPSYYFEVGGIKLAGGKTITMKLDLAKQKLFFKDDDSKRDPYDVVVTRVNTDGTRDFYEHHDLEIAKKTDNYEMDFSKWDGKGDMCFEDDDEGNGFEDDTCSEQSNDKKKPAKPGVAVDYFSPKQPIARLLW